MDTTTIQPNNNLDNDFSEWLSTYGLITAERILERYNIRLPRTELSNAIKNTNTFYHRLILIPLKNIMNGIILQQAHDFQVYAQKLYIDYLLSGETSKSEDSPGGDTRDELEKERQVLIQMGNDFHEQELAQNQLIAESQQHLIKLAKRWNQTLSDLTKALVKDLQTNNVRVTNDLLLQSMNTLLISYDPSKTDSSTLEEQHWLNVEKTLNQSLSKEIRQLFINQINKLKTFILDNESSLEVFFEKIKQMTTTLGDYRNQFYDLILKVSDLLNALPDYSVDPVQTEINKVPLFFDRDLPNK